MSLPRQTIDELVTKYSLEPGILDVFVEGSFDQGVLSLILDNSDRKDVSIYTIDGVDISDEVLEKHALTRGEKQEIIALMLELQGSALVPCYRGLVDRDSDDLFETRCDVAGLRWTPHACLEGLWYNAAFCRHFLVDATRGRPDDFDRFFASLVDVVATLFSFRLAARELGWQLAWYEYQRKDVVVGKAGVTIDTQSCVSKLLQPVGHGLEAEDFLKRADQWKCKILKAPLRGFRGHDLFGLLAKAVEKTGGRRSLASVEALEAFAMFGLRQRPEQYRTVLAEVLA